MPVYYLDTSVILKRYRDEEGTEVVDQLLLDSGPEDRFYTSFLSALEVRAAISRLIRSGQLDRVAAERLLARFLEDSHQVLQTWPLDNSILESAINVADRHGLRSGDASTWRPLPLYFNWPQRWKTYWFPATETYCRLPSNLAWVSWTHNILVNDRINST